MKPKISIIVPVYNTKKHLKKCLNSLVKQSFGDIEIIVVNDGSTDSSQKVIDKYVERYPSKIVPLLIDNQGPGIARNFGINIAKGEYLGFVDSDDWVDRDMFKVLYTMARKGHDFIICDYVEIQQGGRDFRLKGFTGSFFSQKQAVLHSTDTAFSCNKLIKKSLFKNFMFKEGWYEDLATIPLLLTNALSPAYVDEPLYYYKIRSGSITNSNDLKTLDVIASWERLLTNAKPRYKQELIFAVAKNILSFINFKPEFATDFIEFAKEKQKLFESNNYYKEAIKHGSIKNIFTL